MKTVYRINGEVVSRAKFLKKRGTFGKPAVSRAWEKPMACEALAVDPLEVKFERQLDAEQGLNVQYNRDGAPIFTSRSERNAYVRAKGFYDRNAGYGDVCPVNR